MTARLAGALVSTSLRRSASAPPRRRRRVTSTIARPRSFSPSFPTKAACAAAAAAAAAISSSSSSSSSSCMLCKPTLPADTPDGAPTHHSPRDDCRKQAHVYAAVRDCAVVVATTSVGVAVLADRPVSPDPEFMQLETQPPALPTSVSVVSSHTSATNVPLDSSQSKHSPLSKSSTSSTTTTTSSSSSTSTSVTSSSPSSSSPPQPPTDPPATNDKDAFDAACALSTSTVTSSDASSLSDSSCVTKCGEEQRHVSPPEASLAFRSAVVCIPHPEKAEKGGEDAFFIDNRALGVFDGVGGWASIGVDAGLYSKELARLTANYISNEGPATVVDALKSATENNRAIGSSTACVVGLKGAQLVGVNVGDSGLVVIRDAGIVYRTTEQQHYFNCPFQIGTDSLDTVEVGGPVDVTLQHGDWIVMGTDGLWDNVFPSTIVDVVMAHQMVTEGSDSRSSSKQRDNSSDGGSAVSDCVGSGRGGEQAQAIAQKLAECAVKVANDERGSSPFAVNAQNAGHLFLGGKVDDITIIAALVVDPDRECLAGEEVRSKGTC